MILVVEQASSNCHTFKLHWCNILLWRARAANTRKLKLLVIQRVLVNAWCSLTLSQNGQPSCIHGIEECLSISTDIYMFWHLYDGGASGWREQTSPSSISSPLPRAAAGRSEVCPSRRRAGRTHFSQTTPAAETRTAWRFPPRNPHRRRIWIRGPSCWTRCITVRRSTRQALNKRRESME